LLAAANPLGKTSTQADFAKWAIACETAFWPAGTFTNAYDDNRDEAVETIIEGDSVATALRKFMDEPEQQQWAGPLNDRAPPSRF
jgi:hypothetical protein